MTHRQLHQAEENNQRNKGFMELAVEILWFFAICLFKGRKVEA